MPIPFPELSRKPAIKTRERTLDTTQRDEFQNGAEAACATQTRFRREWNVTIEAINAADKKMLWNFVQLQAVGGANPFILVDQGDPTAPENLIVRFASLPAYQDLDNTENGKRFTCTFVAREV